MTRRRNRLVTERRVAWLLSRIPRSLLANIERAAGVGLGKGWGSFSIQDEVDACSRMLGPKSRDAPVVMDIGANVGDWTHALLGVIPTAEVWAFEPGSDAFSALRDRFETDNRVNPVNQAMGKARGTGRLWLDEEASGLASFSYRQLQRWGRSMEKSEVVSIGTVDEFCAQYNVFPDLIKIDTEGHELSVLEGARHALRHVGVVQFEFGGANIDSRTYLRDFVDLLSVYRFKICRITPSGLAQLSPYTERDEAFITTNFIAYRDR